MSDTPRTDAARDYTAPEKLDRLCQQLERERNGAVLAAQNWEETAAQFLRDANFWYGLVTQIGELFGIGAKTADDGTVYDTVVALKVPELVERLLEERNEVIAKLEQVRTLSSKSYFTFPGYALAMKRIEELVGDIGGKEQGEG